MAAKPKTPLAICILTPPVEFANRRIGEFRPDSKSPREKLLSSGGELRDDSVGAIPQGCARGRPFARAFGIGPAASNLSCLHAPLPLPAGSRHCPSGGRGSLRRSQGWLP